MGAWLRNAPELRVLYQVLLTQPGEHLVLGDAPFELIESPGLLQRRVDLSRLRAALLCHVRHPLVDIGFGRRESLACGDRLDHEIATNLPHGHGTKLGAELLPLLFRNL